MTFHARSAVEFALFITRMSDSLLSGAPLERIAELVREHLSGSAAAIAVEDRQGPGHDVVAVAEAEGSGAASAGATRLSELLRAGRHVSASAFSERDGSRCTLTVLRAAADTPFDAEEARVCEVLAAQVRRGLDLSSRIGATEIERSLYSSVMDRLYVGMVILDAGGRVMRASAPAEAAIAARDGLQVQAGRLRATLAREDRELQQAIKAAAQGAGPARALSLTKASGSRHLGLLVQPIPDALRTGSAGAAAAVYIRDCEAGAEIEGELVRQLFDLTPAEAAVVRRLTLGLTLEDAAASLDISRNTARAHLRSIFSKSGITRQTELVRLVLNSAAVLGGRPLQAA